VLDHVVDTTCFAPLWLQWHRTYFNYKRRVILVDADSDTSWTPHALHEEIDKFLKLLPMLENGARVAFSLPNGAQWVALFLALQKLRMIAIPLDAGLPEKACFELAHQLNCQALYYRGKFHALTAAKVAMRNFCCIKLTSGTSGGLPNQVPCLATHLLADGTNIIQTMGIRPADRNLASIPLGHSYGLGNFIMPLILQGTCLVCAGRFVPDQLATWMREYKITIFPSVPSLFRILAIMPGQRSLTPLRLAISAGAPLTPEVARSFFKRYKIKIHNFYGSSETGGICYDRSGNATLSGRSVGKPLTGVTVTIKDHRIVVTSPAVAKRMGRWRVPDRGEWNDKGELVLLGRHGRAVNLEGKKVHPSEVENVLRTTPGVSDAIVWAATDSERNYLHAAVETRLTLGDIQRALSARLPEWKFPKRYLILAEFPRNARGKVNVAALRRSREAKT